MIVTCQHPQKSGIRSPPDTQGGGQALLFPHSRVLPSPTLWTICRLLATLSAMQMFCRYLDYIVYWTAMGKVSQHAQCIWNMNNFDLRLFESTDMGFSPLLVCSMRADRPTDTVLTSSLCCLQIHWDQTAGFFSLFQVLFWVLKFNTISSVSIQNTRVSACSDLIMLQPLFASDSESRDQNIWHV